MLEYRHAPELFSLVDSCREHLREWLPWLNENQSVKAGESFIEMSIKQLAVNEGFQERLGFLKEGTVREAEWLYDHFVDLVVYGMLESDWRSEEKTGPWAP